MLLAVRLPHQETTSTCLVVGRLPQYRRWVREELGGFSPSPTEEEKQNGIKMGSPFSFLVGKAISDAVATDTHHFQDYCRGCDGLLEERFLCRLEFAVRACAHSGVLAAVLLTSLLMPGKGRIPGKRWRILIFSCCVRFQHCSYWQHLHRVPSALYFSVTNKYTSFSLTSSPG